MVAPDTPGESAALAVEESFMRTGIDPDACVFLEDSSLALSGLSVATRVDLLVHPDVYDELSDRGQTPNGIKLVPMEASPRSRRMVSPADESESYLPLDLQTRSGRARWAYFSHVRDTAGEYRLHTGIFKVINLETLAAQKVLGPAEEDIRQAAMIREHLARLTVQAG